jgi:hypothetical protein
MKQAASRALLVACFIVVYCLSYSAKPEDGRDIFLLNVGWLHGVISQKRELFITIAVRTSNVTQAEG